MAANTSKGITYPTSGDSITPLETVFATMASTTNTALTSINAGTDITAGTLPITRGGTGGTTQATAASALGVVPLSSYSVAGKNAIINGAFNVWQRTTTTNSTTSTGYWADRWRYTATGGTSKALTQSKEAFQAGTAPVAGYESAFYLKVAVSTAGSGYTYEAIEQPIEDVRTYAGSTVTVSFWAKTTGSTVNATPRLTQNFGTGGSTEVITAGSSIAITASWTRFTQTLNVPSIAGKSIAGINSALIFALVPNFFNALYTIEIWGVQVEQGSVATNFSTTADSIAGEVALCQRYYYRVANIAPTATCTVASGMRFSTTVAWAFIPFPQTMRTPPLALETGGTVNVVTTSGLDASSTVFGEASTNGARIACTTTAVAAAGVGVVVRLAGTAGTSYLGFSAEI